jgi:hypothetical protein
MPRDLAYLKDIVLAIESRSAGHSLHSRKK